MTVISLCAMVVRSFQRCFQRYPEISEVICSQLFPYKKHACADLSLVCFCFVFCCCWSGPVAGGGGRGAAGWDGEVCCLDALLREDVAHFVFTSGVSGLVIHAVNCVMI